MSMYRTCTNCFQQEGIRFNFGDNHDAEAKFHRERWCKCGYSSPEEMMADQDLGFDDPRWVPITKYFLNQYYLRISQGSIINKDEHVRFFLKLLKSSINNYHLSAELVQKKADEEYKFIYNGKTEKIPKINIFKNSFELEHVPEMVVLDNLNREILQAYKKSQQSVIEIKKKVINRNRWIAGLILSQIIITVIAVVALTN